MASIGRRKVIFLVAVVAVAVVGLSVAVVAALRSTPRPAEAHAQQSAPPPDGLRVHGARQRLRVGTAVGVAGLTTNIHYRDQIVANFDTLTTEDALKWSVVEPKRGVYDWKAADEIVKFARSHNQEVRGHVLIWHGSVPDWLANGGFSKEELREIARTHIKTVMSRYKGQITTWDVVNEPFEHGKGAMRDSFWLRKLGPEYIADAFRWAREADPGAKLHLNEYGTETKNSKSNALYELVRNLRRVNVPIDGVGFQNHVTYDGTLATFRENLRRFTDLGVDVSITEMDVRMPAVTPANGLEAQANLYESALRDCLAVPRCVSFAVWGHADPYSWVPQQYPNWGNACLYDAELKPKPAYGRIRDLLRDSPPRQG